MDFSQRHVVVTGGTGALGSAVVGRLLSAGATCHIPAFEAAPHPAWLHRDEPRVQVTWGVDLADEAAVSAFYGALPSLWASIHCAGGFDMSPVAETSLAALRRQLSMNVETCFLACREAVKVARRGGGGRLVNVTARPALEPRGGAGMVAYTSSKAAVAALTAALAAEVAGENILVNAVAPSIIDTPANRAAMPGADHSRWPTPVELAETLCWLASPQNTVTTGAIVPVSGRT